MATIGSVNIDLDANIAGLVRSLSQAERHLTSVQRQATQAVNTLRNFALSVGGIYAVAKAIDKVTEATTNFMNINSQFEQLSARMTSFTGSVVENNAEMYKANQFALQYKQSIVGTTETLLLMKNSGLDSSTRSLKIYANTAIGAGKSINQFAEAMADALTGENERLKEFGVKASAMGNKVQYAWTDSSGKARKVIIANNKDIIDSTLGAIFNEKYAGQLEAFATTWAGTVQDVRNKWTNFNLEVGKNGLYAYISTLSTTVMDSLGLAFGGAGDSAKNFSDSIIAYINNTILSIGGLYDVITGIRLVWATMANTAIQSFVAINEAGTWWSDQFSNIGISMQNAWGKAGVRLGQISIVTGL